MLEVLAILSGAVFTAAVSIALGKLLLRALRLEFYRAEEHVFAFACGSACLSALVFAMAALRLVRPGYVVALGLAVLLAAALRGAHRPLGKPLPPLPLFWKALFFAPFAIFAAAYLLCAMAPVTAPDAIHYHLGLVARYFKAHGFYRITTDMYASLSQGVEMLFLFAFAIGRHSAAAMVHFSFLLALPLAMLLYARRFGFPGAGATGALLVFLSPIVGWDGTTAYIDVAVAMIAFTLFYLLQIWDRERTPALLVPIGLLAGFCYAMKYTAAVAVPFALAFVAWKLWRKRQPALVPLATVAACALVMIVPWMLKNWIWVDNPVAPFFNELFPNQYMHIAAEQEYRRYMANWGDLKSRLEIPWEVTLGGTRLQGIIGPVFLMSPLALLALRYREGRPLLLAALVFASVYPANIGTRFLITMLPFLALALALAMKDWRGAAPALIVVHAISAWPAVLGAYSKSVLRIEEIPVRAALRVLPPDEYLRWRVLETDASRMLDERVPDGARVFSLNAPPEAYHSRDVLVGYQAALNDNLREQLMAAGVPIWQPSLRFVFRFPRQSLSGLRLLQSASHPIENWSVSEFRVYDGGRELERRAGWRLRANPNPWEVQMAFDNNPGTRWKSWQKLSPGMQVEVRFPAPEAADRVELIITPDQYHARVSLEGLAAGGGWRALSASPELSQFEPPWNLRRLAMIEMKLAGIDYIILNDGDPLLEDVRAGAAVWGVRPIETRGAYTLFHIEEGPDLATPIPRR